MKVFWSWQSDTPGKTGRHFVRDALNDAIETLRVANDVEEPSEREARDALHLDHDRKGLSGSPDLAPAIFKKITETAVFVADVTLTGETIIEGSKGIASRKKKHINSNVAIEYGYALNALGDAAILMVQNRCYGDREDLPFDLKHKAGPLQYMLQPDATKAQIDAERARLNGEFVTALRPYLSRASATQEPAVVFREVPFTTKRAFFFQPSDILAQVGEGTKDRIDYQFNEPSAFYLRLIPTLERPPIRLTDLYDLVRQQQIDLLTRVIYAGYPARNKFGAVLLEPHGTSASPRSLTQLFTNGEFWGITTDFFQRHGGERDVPSVNVENICGRVLGNYCSVAAEKLGITSPYTIVFGAIGLSGKRLAMRNNGYSGLIHSDEFEARLVLNDASPSSQEGVIGQFMDTLFDLAGERRA
jgi:hypothetical protein